MLSMCIYTSSTALVAGKRMCVHMNRLKLAVGDNNV
jgi:hypothetical protein